jgi:hypothetical protein
MGASVYLFDTELRTFSYRTVVERGGAFEYRSRREFSTKIKRLTGLRPSPLDTYLFRVPIPPEPDVYFGVAVVLRLVERVNISWQGRFPRLGWVKLVGDHIDGVDRPLELRAEGDPLIRRHLERERDRALRSAAVDYWTRKTGTLCCLACGFSFEDTYGHHGVGFIEMHHDVPLSAGPRRSSPRDLKPLCELPSNDPSDFACAVTS